MVFLDGRKQFKTEVCLLIFVTNISMGRGPLQITAPSFLVGYVSLDFLTPCGPSVSVTQFVFVVSRAEIAATQMPAKILMTLTCERRKRGQRYTFLYM